MFADVDFQRKIEEYKKARKGIMEAISEISFWKNRMITKIEQAVKNGVLKTSPDEFAKCLDCNFDQIKSLLDQDEPK